MFNFSSKEYNQQCAKDKLMEERLRKDNTRSNYKSDNDIFGLKSNKVNQETKVYNKTAKEIFESRIDNKFKDTCPFFAGQRNENYVSSNLKSNVVFGTEKNNYIGTNKSKLIYNEKEKNSNIGNIEKADNRTNRIQEAKSLKSLQKINNCSMSQILTHSISSLHEIKTNRNANSDVDLNFNRIYSAPKFDSARERLIQKENQITKSRYNTVQNDHKENIVKIHLEDDFDIKEYTQNVNENLNDQKDSLRRVQSCEDILIHYKDNPIVDNEMFSISKNSTASKADSKSLLNVPVKPSNHEDLEVLKKSLLMERINKRDKLTYVASQSFSDLSMLDRNIKEKNKLQEKYESEAFFFHKEKRDAKVEKAKLKNEVKDKIIESFVEKRIYNGDHKPKTSGYFQKLKESQIEKLRDLQNLQILKNKQLNQFKETQEYKSELLSQMKSKKEKESMEKNNEKNEINQYYLQEQEKEKIRKSVTTNIKENNKKNIIRVNSGLLEIKKTNFNKEKERKLYEFEKERKIKELYDKELREAKEKNDKYKKFMVNVLAKQVEEKKKKESEYKEERKSMKFHPGLDIKKKLSFSKI